MADITISYGGFSGSIEKFYYCEDSSDGVVFLKMFIGVTSVKYNENDNIYEFIATTYEITDDDIRCNKNITIDTSTIINSKEITKSKFGKIESLYAQIQQETA